MIDFFVTKEYNKSVFVEGYEVDLKRVICLLLAVSAAILFVSCGEPEPTEPATHAATAAPTEAATPDEDDDRTALTNFVKSFNTDAQLDEQVIHDEEGVSLTLTGIEYDPINGPTVVFEVGNTGDKEITVQTDSVAVNGYMMTTSMIVTVPPAGGERAMLCIPYTALALAGVDRIAELELSFRITRGDVYDKYDTIAPLVFRTTAADGYTQEYDESGQQVYDKDGVRIILKGLDDSRVFADGEALKVYMVNDTDKAVAVQAERLTVNGYEFTSVMNSDILPGKRAVDILTIFDMDMEEYGIEKIDSVELSFKLLDESSWQVIGETKLISAELEQETENG